MYWHCRKQFQQGRAFRLAFFVRHAELVEVPMIEAHSKSRQQAEIAFMKVQTQFFSKNNAMEEVESVAQARDAKTLRLREERLAKELADRLSATRNLIAKRANTR
jgi:hypothetical protein